MPISGADFYNITSGSLSVADAKKKSEENSTLSIDDFFTLMSAQMQNQTMYDSVDTADYMAQLVQYTTLAQLKELTASNATSYAVSLIGKNVEVLGTMVDGSEAVLTGTVEQVAFDGGTPYVLVGGVYYEASDILAVTAGATPSEEPAAPETETETETQVTDVTDVGGDGTDAN
ncbi:MAG TPA: flagellar hook capping FlgD N-terminal domain-containing protein [Candidatus Acidoferrum sp.]|nr:flagellar hook capping FlgD N-terminal domain-containing protein [Candidatus Acidoferrum sp.]